MALHTTNYYNTFIEVAEDCPTQMSQPPSAKVEKQTIADIQFELLVKNPYKFTSDDVLFQVFAIRNDLTQAEHDEARNHFFSNGQPCFRASPLTKRYGFGVHADKDGKIAIFGRETREYEQFVNDDTIKKVKAMRSTKK